MDAVRYCVFWSSADERLVIGVDTASDAVGPAVEVKLTRDSPGLCEFIGWTFKRSACERYATFVVVAPNIGGSVESELLTFVFEGFDKTATVVSVVFSAIWYSLDTASVRIG